MVSGLGNNTNPAIASGGAAAATEGPTAGFLNNQKDAVDSPTSAKFGEIWKQIQSKYGAKAEKPREIKKQLGKDDFLRIMISQMRHQDPTKPFDAEQMAQQMAQFASVEQLQNINQGMTKLAEKNGPMERLALTNLIGKTVTVDRGRFPHTEGQNESLGFALPGDAASVKVQVQNDTGEIVTEKDLGPMKKGDQSFIWDGKKMNTLPAKAGTYNFIIQALDQQGNELQLNPTTKARVVGIAFEGQEAVLLVGDSKHQDKIMLRNVMRIDEGGIASSPQMPTTGGNPSPLPDSVSVAPSPAGAEAPTAPPSGGKNFFSFEKGKGSSNLSANDLAAQMPADAQAALAAYQAQAAAPSAERGFPSGLSDPEQQGPQTPNSNAATIQKGGEDE